jgi:hypothetical protein
MSWFTWLGRSEEKRTAFARLERLRQAYGDQGERVIKLSARTDLARKAAGSTMRAFAFVEHAFADATGEYAQINTMIESLEAGLAHGDVGDFLRAETLVKGLGPKLDTLSSHLTEWEATWSQVPLAIDSIARVVALLRTQVDQVAQTLGSSLPLSGSIDHLEQFLERIRQTMAAGNPIEANHLVDDLQLALVKVTEKANQYASGQGAIRQATADLAKARAQGPNDALVTALNGLDEQVSQLHAVLATGNFDQFQHDLYQVQRSIAAIR